MLPLAEYANEVKSKIKMKGAITVGRKKLWNDRTACDLYDLISHFLAVKLQKIDIFRFYVHCNILFHAKNR